MEKRHVSPADDPLESATAESWSALICDAGPASILVVIDRWIGKRLSEVTTSEDVWQDTLLEAWRLREGYRWQGARAFRRWLLEIARHRILRLSERGSAVKHGGGVRVNSFSALTGPDDDSPYYAGPVRTTTPSQAARDREIATVMRDAIASLPDDLREVVALRLFEDLTVDEISRILNLGRSAVRNRVRRGLELYRQRLSAAMGDGLWSDGNP